MFYLFFYVICHALLVVCGLQEKPSAFTFEFLSENGNIISNNCQSDLCWVRFQDVNKNQEIYWLKLAAKKAIPYPVIVKNSNRTEKQIHTLPANCLFSAASHLIPGYLSPLNDPSSGKRAKREMRLVSSLAIEYKTIEFLTISLCHGISGVVHLWNSSLSVYMHAAEHSSTVDLQVISSDQFKRPQIVYQDPLARSIANTADATLSRHHQRIKRSSFDMPVRPIPGPFLVELYIIVDSKMASLNGHAKLLSRIAAIMNQLNLAFSQFNVYFTVVQLEIWEYDQIKLTDENHILMELQLYKRRFITKRHDCLHAILGENIGSARRGLSEPASMCGYNNCVGYTKDYYYQSELEIAYSVLHEIGHNFGLNHDTEQCQCSGCIMATGVEFGNCKFQWSICSKKEIESRLKSGIADCLLDRPISNLADLHPVVMKQNHKYNSIDHRSTPMCGNGVVENGEQCDCGGSKQCESAFNHCCNPDTCQFRFGASCASGACCDLKRCALKTSGTVCRNRGQEDCDLPEYCDGLTEWCPTDVYKKDGISCTTAITSEWSHCYRGACQSRNSWCKVLWGVTGNEASQACYDMNRAGELVKNCGLEIPKQVERDRQPRNWIPLSCSDENSKCGRLWCSHENERVLRSSPQLSVDEMLNEDHCSAVRFDMDWFLDDAGMVPNGAVCASGKMCWKGACVEELSVMKNDRCNCHGHGVCNNFGHCHCDSGFAPPNCTMSGSGGSVDSGPPGKFSMRSRVITGAVVISLIVIVTLLVLSVFIYHYQNKTWPWLLALIKCPDYKKSSNHYDTGHSKEADSRYSKFQRPSKLILKVDMKYESDHHIKSPLYSPKSPDKSPIIPYSVKAKAHFLENLQNKPGTKSTPKPLIESFKTSNAITPKSIKSDNFRPEILSKKPIKPVEAKPEKSVVKEASANHLPVILTAKPPKTDIISPKVSSVKPFKISDRQEMKLPTLVHKEPPPKVRPNATANEKPKPNMLAKEVSKSSHQMLRSKFEKEKPPPLLIDKPTKKSESNAPALVCDKPSKTHESNHVKPMKPLKYEISHPKLQETSSQQIKTASGPQLPPKFTGASTQPPILAEKPQKPPPASNATADSQTRTKDKIKSKPLKHEISQPRLEQTTCTDATSDLPSTDKTLTRVIGPHKVLKCDPHKAVKK